MAVEELVQVVDEQDNPVGGATKEENQRTGNWYRVVRIMIENELGQLLLQRRASDVILYPGRWESSASGHVPEEEDYLEAAKRELREELGITDIELEEIGHYPSQNEFDDRKLNEWQKAYRAVVPSSIATDLQASEVQTVHWFELEYVESLVAQHPGQVTPGLKGMIERFY
jgi:16S rRNA (adenine1518-N6/adenine1519-N6)-dimethyltransferase